MENSEFPRFHVLDEWFGADNAVCVQLVEVARDRKEQLSGGLTGLHLRFADTRGDTTVGLFISPAVGVELAAAIGAALQRHERLSGKE
jgi:hypothetical protein